MIPAFPLIPVNFSLFQIMSSALFKALHIQSTSSYLMMVSALSNSLLLLYFTIFSLLHLKKIIFVFSPVSTTLFWLHCSQIFEKCLSIKSTLLIFQSSLIAAFLFSQHLRVLPVYRMYNSGDVSTILFYFGLTLSILFSGIM